MKIVATFNIPDSEVDLEKWNKSAEVNGEDESLETPLAVGEYLCALLEEGAMTLDDIFEDFNPVVDFETKAD